MLIFESVFSLQVCPVTVPISLSQCVHRMDALTPVPASPAVWVSKTISLSLDLVSPRIPVILTSAQKAKGKLNSTAFLQPKTSAYQVSAVHAPHDESAKGGEAVWLTCVVPALGALKLESSGFKVILCYMLRKKVKVTAVWRERAAQNSLAARLAVQM